VSKTNTEFVQASCDNSLNDLYSLWRRR